MSPSIIRLEHTGLVGDNPLGGVYTWTEYRSGGEPIYFNRKRKTVIFYDALDKEWKVIKINLSRLKSFKKNYNNMTGGGLITSSDFENWTGGYRTVVLSDDWSVREEQIKLQSVQDTDSGTTNDAVVPGVAIALVLLLFCGLMIYLFEMDRRKNKQEVAEENARYRNQQQTTEMIYMEPNPNMIINSDLPPEMIETVPGQVSTHYYSPTIASRWKTNYPSDRLSNGKYVSTNY